MRLIWDCIGYETNEQAKAYGFFYSRAEAEADLSSKGWTPTFISPQGHRIHWSKIGERGQFRPYPTLTPRFTAMIARARDGVRFDIETSLDGCLLDEEVRAIETAT